MSIAEQVRSTARHEYRLVRTAARAVDRRLEYALGTTPGLGAALSRVRATLRAVDHRVDPASRPDITTPAADHTDEQREPTPAPAAPDEVEQLAEEFLEDENDHHAGELADSDDLRDVQARLRAKHAVQEQHEQQS